MEAMTSLDALAHRVSAGDMVSDDDARLLLASHDLIAVGMMGDEVRRRLHDRRTTFVRVFEIHVDAVPASMPTGVRAGEVRLIGNPVSIDRARAAVQAARILAPVVPLTGFSLADVAAWDGSTSDACRALHDAGLDAVAEVPLDRLTNAPGAIEAARVAGLSVPRLTVDSVDGDRLALITQAVQLQRAFGGFKAFAPLPRRVPSSAPTTGYDDVKLIALARLIAVEIPSIQVDWAIYGPKLAQVALTVGADDVDGVAADAGTLGPRRSPIEEIRNNIRAAGLEPVERSGLFEPYE
jgi:hypothetical protein